MSFVWCRAKLTGSRSAFSTSVLISGPAAANEPSLNSTWWNNWASFVASNNSVPDQYAWHEEGGGGSLSGSNDGLHQIISTYKLPMRPININEYGTFPEQVNGTLDIDHVHLLILPRSQQAQHGGYPSSNASMLMVCVATGSADMLSMTSWHLFSASRMPIHQATTPLKKVIGQTAIISYINITLPT